MEKENKGLGASASPTACSPSGSSPVPGLAADALRPTGADTHPFIRMSDERGDFVTGDDGCVVFWPEDFHRGGFNAWHLRLIADELDRRNAPFLAQMDEFFGALPKAEGQQ